MMAAEFPAQPNTSPDSFLGLVYDVLFAPVGTFRRLAETQEDERQGNRLLFYGLVAVVLVSALAPVAHMAALGGKLATLIYKVPLGVLLGLMFWGGMALLLGLLSYAYTGQVRIRTFLTLSGLATLPWIFLGPALLFKVNLGMFGVLLSAALGLLVALWAIALFTLAVMNAFNMSLEKALVILIMPMPMVLVFFGWIFGFIWTVVKLMPVG